MLRQCLKLYSFYGALDVPPDRQKTDRELQVQQLSHEIFSCGNKFLKNAHDIFSLPEGKQSFPEVCFIGRPNAGKSALISTLCHNKRLVHRGKEAGTTKMLQFFNVGDALLLVDTPGYGAWKDGLVDRVSLQAISFAATRRYISIRKAANLKRLYWVMEASLPSNSSEGAARMARHLRFTRTSLFSSPKDMRPIGRMTFTPRDDEIFEFLKAERVPFTVLLNKCDRYKSEPGRLLRDVADIHLFFGSDEVPLLEVSSHGQNVEKLQHDIVFNCSHELTRLEDLTLPKMRQLSYMPASAPEQIRVEERFPTEAHLVPLDDSMSMRKLVSRHEAAKERFVAGIEQHGKGRSALSSLELARVTHSHFSPQLRTGLDDEKRVKEFMLEGEKECESPQIGSDAEGASDDEPHDPLRIRREWEARRRSGVGAPAGVMETPASVNVLVAAAANHDDLRQERSGEGLTDQSSDSVQCAGGIGTPLPKSMIPNSIRTTLINKDQTAEQYEDIMLGGYERTIQTRQDFFMARPRDVQYITSEKEEKQLQLHRASGFAQSKFRENRNRLRSKYLRRIRKDRGIMLHAEGYMCPWLGSGGGGVGRTNSSQVVTGDGAADGGPRSEGGQLMMGLKQRGLGGRSLSPNTLRQRGRATPKTGFWAA